MRRFFSLPIVLATSTFMASAMENFAAQDDPGEVFNPPRWRIQYKWIHVRSNLRQGETFNYQSSEPLQGICRETRNGLLVRVVCKNGKVGNALCVGVNLIELQFTCEGDLRCNAEQGKLKQAKRMQMMSLVVMLKIDKLASMLFVSIG